ncbi:MAG: MATE family efflux transporter, partial [Dehalococcoidales bacterium]|nr:MATE family efflux transporter [Dehalococcoidales bacterium]
LLMGVIFILLEIFAPKLVAIFNDDAALMAIAVPAMRIYLSTLCIIGPSILFITTFQGLSKGTVAMVLSLVRQFVFFVPLLFVLPRILGMTGIWLSMPISDTLGFLVSGCWLYREYRIQKRSGQWSDLSSGSL